MYLYAHFHFALMLAIAIYPLQTQQIIIYARYLNGNALELT